MQAASKLALGSVQFGLDYGVTHSGGRVPDADIFHILDLAAAAGIDTIDTAAAYGDAEAALGRVRAGNRFRIITKTIPAKLGTPGALMLNAVEERFRQSLKLLDVPSVDTVLVHAPNDLHAPGGESLWRFLQLCKDEGLARRIGVSIYDETDLTTLRFPCEPDVVQLPLNVLDQRLLRSGFLARLRDGGAAIHIRSVFLQGLLLTQPADLPKQLRHLQSDIARWSAACGEVEVSPVAAALHFAMSAPGVERVVVGVHSLAHLREIIAASVENVPEIDWPSLAVKDPRTVDPRFWPKE
jgi:aryl-alcohol dehydrogenase-like predicted oxidoreductase